MRLVVLIDRVERLMSESKATVLFVKFLFHKTSVVKRIFGVQQTVKNQQRDRLRSRCDLRRCLLLLDGIRRRSGDIARETKLERPELRV